MPKASDEGVVRRHRGDEAIGIVDQGEQFGEGTARLRHREEGALRIEFEARLERDGRRPGSKRRPVEVDVARCRSRHEAEPHLVGPQGRSETAPAQEGLIESVAGHAEVDHLDVLAERRLEPVRPGLVTRDLGPEGERAAEDQDPSRAFAPLPAVDA